MLPGHFLIHFILIILTECALLQIMLVSGSRNKHRWVVPGGGIEPTEDEGVAALREVHEEAGVKGMLARHLGVFDVSVNGCFNWQN